MQLCPTGTGSSFERFEFARYLSPFNGSPREWRGFDRSVCETETNIHGLQSAWDIIKSGKA